MPNGFRSCVLCCVGPSETPWVATSDGISTRSPKNSLLGRPLGNANGLSGCDCVAHSQRRLRHLAQLGERNRSRLTAPDRFNRKLQFFAMPFIEGAAFSFRVAVAYQFQAAKIIQPRG